MNNKVALVTAETSGIRKEIGKELSVTLSNP